ncbi:sulfite exporter TauE/SafE family protein [Lysinibacillus pakistanensis]|uniref:Probable membrane transporter protein n=1 Tax=Lysinibacillus pakistanensis TaxID=759811 RepID=A0AAX3WSH3_9BACI|nr:sulfite exporter TauE/SafE family protein [Lysinibacillus pakistanensis]MDM5230111.1 sulfite exporter TauE/SafE family protein [Lysinibacillus pakistanensis]WHY45709.1 sulfite exporter TauE/SafE family protein [Lysinibacillus pakistanensis]WHY50717.1 sulfite exporter TauE/SafE family protein [Lysinibacillus pakistanensis]
MEFFLLVIIALFSGLVGALVGLGGGIILVPATLFVGLNLGMIPDITPQKVVGLSVVMMIFTGLASTLSFMKSKTVDYKSGLLFFIGSVPGTMLGAWVNKGLDLPSFNLYFGILLIILATILLVRDKLKPVKWFVKNGTQREFTDTEGNTFVYGYPIWFAIILTFCIGFASGLFGIGGGSMIVPAMIILFLFPPHVAVATSMFLVFLSSLVGSASHIYLGHVPWLYTIPVIPGAYIGAKFGAALNKRIKSETLVVALRIILLLMGIRSIIEGLL